MSVTVEPVVLENSQNGNIQYPESAANLIHTADGRNVEAVLGLDNMPSTLPNNIGGAFNKITSDLTELKNASWGASNEINISGYTSSNQYVTQKNGYACVANEGSNNGLLRIVSAVGGTNFAIGGAIGRYSVFVRKGTKLYIQGTVTSSLFIEC